MSGPKNTLEPYPGQDPETKAKGCCGPPGLHRQQHHPLSSGPSAAESPAEGSSLREENGSWHSEGQTAFQRLDTLGHTQQHFREYMIPSKNEWHYFISRASWEKFRMPTLKVISETWKPHQYTIIFSSLRSMDILVFKHCRNPF